MTLLDRPINPAELERDLGLTRWNVSSHLACLCGCGIVDAEPEGRQTRYEIAELRLARAFNAFVEITLAVDENVVCIDPACRVSGCANAGADT